MIEQMTEGIMIPFLGTSLGAACVFLLNRELSQRLKQALMGFAAGVMTAACIWSLLLPAIELADNKGKFAFFPAAVGVMSGIGVLLTLDWFIPVLYRRKERTEETGRLSQEAMLMLAVTLHNLPEGMAVGVVYAGLLYGNTQITAAGALVLSLGIAVQNIPEGAIISMPMKAAGRPKGKAFGYGVLSGVAEPLGALLTILAAGLLVPILPYLLSFSAGAMLYVVVEELVPEIAGEQHSTQAITLFGIGFVLMMILDVTLG